MNALVTGATGLLGLATVKQLLARGDGVRAVCRDHSEELAALGAEILIADLHDRNAILDACRDTDVVFHTAAVIGTSGPWDRYCATNYFGTRYVVDGCLKHGVGRLIFSSCASITFDGAPRKGDSPLEAGGQSPFRAERGVDESVPSPARWLNHYLHTKALAERQVLSADGLENLRTCVLRPALIWGPGDRHFLPWLVNLARRGRLRRIGDGTNLLETVYVDNAAEAHLLAADALFRSARFSQSETCDADTTASPAGRAYFITQEEPVNCWQWINDLLALSGLPPVAGTISLDRAWKAGAWNDLFRLMFRRKADPALSRFQVVQLGRTNLFDTTAARRDLGYAARVSTADGMRCLAACQNVP